MKLLSFFSKKYTALGFSIVCGIAYLIIITSFVLDFTNASGGLLIFFFFPAIICGSALLIFKAIKTYIEYETTRQLSMLFWSHIIVILLAILMLLEMIIL